MENQKINLMTMDEFTELSFEGRFAKCQELSEMNTLLNMKIQNILLKEELKKLNKEFCGYTLEYLLEKRTMDDVVIIKAPNQSVDDTMDDVKN
jgi:hypothetical protein